MENNNNFEWNGYTFETKQEMIKFANDTVVSDRIKKGYDDLYNETCGFHKVTNCHKLLAKYLLKDINNNYKSVARFYNVQYLINQLMEVL